MRFLSRLSRLAAEDGTNDAAQPGRGGGREAPLQLDGDRRMRRLGQEPGNRPEAHEPDFILGGGDEQRSSARVGAASEGTGHLGADFRVGMEGQRMKRVIGSGTQRFGEGARGEGAHFLAVVPSQTQEFRGVSPANRAGSLRNQNSRKRSRRRNPSARHARRPKT